MNCAYYIDNIYNKRHIIKKKEMKQDDAHQYEHQN